MIDDDWLMMMMTMIDRLVDDWLIDWLMMMM